MKSLDVSKLKKVVEKTENSVDTDPRTPRVDSWPSREVVQQETDLQSEPTEQLNIRGPKSVLDRFKSYRKYPRQPFYDVLQELMDRADRE